MELVSGKAGAPAKPVFGFVGRRAAAERMSLRHRRRRKIWSLRRGGEAMPLTRETPLTDLPGVGPARGKKLEKLGLRTLGDTLDHLPQRYEDRRERHTLRDAPEDRPCCVCAMVAETPRVSYLTHTESSAST